MGPSTKILILSANPQDTARLRLDKEVREIQEGLRRSKERDRFVIQHVWAVRLRDLRRAILDHEPDIVHFCGHGELNGLMVEDEEGKSVLVRPEALSGLFELFSEQVGCVLLNACYSQTQAEAINEHIGYVIGMNKGIRDITAIEFAVGFYDALGAGKTVEEAFRFGCNAIELYNIPENLVPVLNKNSNSITNIVHNKSQKANRKFSLRQQSDLKSHKNKRRWTNAHTFIVVTLLIVSWFIGGAVPKLILKTPRPPEKDRSVSSTLISPSSPNVTIVESDVVEIPVGSDPIPLRVQIEGSSYHYEWNLDGPGEFEGDRTRPAIFYIPPNRIEQESVGAIITIRIIDREQQEIIESLFFKVISSEIIQPKSIPASLVVSIPNQNLSTSTWLAVWKQDVQLESMPIVVPEPTTFVLFSMGLICFWLFDKRR